MQEQLNQFVESMREVVKRYPQFSPYKPDARVSILHDSPAKRLTCEMKMMLGKEPNSWSRVYFVKDLDEKTMEVITYDLIHALGRDVGLMAAMVARPEDRDEG